jgi:hypothetical protein
MVSLLFDSKGITMRLANVLQRVMRLGGNANETGSSNSSGRASEQRDDTSMADFVRILRGHDGQQRN